MIRFLLSFVLLHSAFVLAAPTAGQYELRKRRSDGLYDSYGVTLLDGQVIGQTAGIPAAITVGSGGDAEWGMIGGTLTDQTDLADALAAKLSIAAAISGYQPKIGDGTPTTLSEYGITDGITLDAANAAYQPKSSVLTSISSLGITQGGHGNTDSFKLAQYSGGGGFNVSGAVSFYAVGGGVTTLNAPDSMTSADINLPTTGGDLALKTDSITGNAAGLSATLAVASGGTGATSYTDGQLLIGNSTGGTLTKATLTAGTNVTITNGHGTITISATGGGGGGGTGVYRNITVKASEMIPRVTNGPLVNSSETSTNKVNYDTLDFDPATVQYAQVWVRMPDEWDAGAFKVKFTWLADSGSGNVVWRASAAARGDNEAADVSQGSTDGVIDTLQSGNVCVSNASNGITASGTPAAGKWLILEISRNASDVSDTLATNARLIGITLQYKESSTSPASW